MDLQLSIVSPRHHIVSGGALCCVDLLFSDGMHMDIRADTTPLSIHCG